VFADSGASGEPPPQLPELAVSDVTAPVFEVVLHFMYTDTIGALSPSFLTDEGAEKLFDAADRYLLFTMKACLSRKPFLLICAL
jgi:hypothetical protein